ncbi:MAG: prepilin peptidase, partial [Oscillospiraceae bacterium]
MELSIYYGVIIFLFGIVIGSFLNVLIYRLPKEISIAKGFSMCPKCTHRLMPVDLVPLFSWIFLKGKCRYCKEPIPFIYPAVELINGILWLLAYIMFGLSFSLISYFAILSCLLVVVFTDWQQMIIPDSMDVTILLAGILLIFISDSLPLKERLIGLVCVSVPMLILALVSGGRAMGGGDIKLMAALGLCMGWKQTLLITFGGAVLGTITYLILLKTKNKMARQIPYGTFLSIMGIISLLFG